MNMPATITLDRDNTSHAALVVQDLFDAGSKPGAPEMLSFHDVASEVRSLRDLLDPQDFERPLSQASARYDDAGKLALCFRGVTEGAWEDPMSFTSNGYKQFGSRVLGSGKALQFVARQATRDETGRSMAEINWAVELAAQGGDVSRLRTVQLPGQPTRSVRAVMSQSYGYFDNVDVIDALLGAEGIDSLHVVHARITEDAMRIRFLLNPEDAALFGRNGALTRETLNKPIPMAEIWNSEVGGSSVRARSGIWIARCTNGQMNSWSGQSDWRWAHRGGSDFHARVSNGLGEAVRSFRVEASGAVEKYEERMARQSSTSVESVPSSAIERTFSACCLTSASVRVAGAGSGTTTASTAATTSGRASTTGPSSAPPGFVAVNGGTGPSSASSARISVSMRSRSARTEDRGRGRKFSTRRASST